MKTYSCDKCGQALKLAWYFNVGFPFGGHVDLCVECAKPYLLLIKKQGLMNSDIEHDLEERQCLSASYTEIRQ